MTADERGGSIDIGGLLTIDVASELRKLSQAQLQGPWQIPAELVRRALRCGATEIAVELGRQRARTVDDSRGVSIELLMWTGVLLDVRRPNSERHQALTTLEAHGELALLAAAGLPPRTLRVRSRSEGAVHTLEFDGKTVHIATANEPGPNRLEVQIEGAGIERRAAHDWLADAARFASATVRIDGEIVAPGFAGAFAQCSLRAPLRGRLSVPSQGETAHAWLLEHGIVTGHVAIPDAPCFEAAVEFGEGVQEVGAARLRDALQSELPSLIDQGVALMLRVGAQAQSLGEPGRARVARLLLQAARKHLRTDEVMRAEVFRAVDGHGERLVDLARLQAATVADASGARTLQALYPSQRVDAFALGDTLVLVADEVERSLLTEVLHVRMRAPETRDTKGGWGVAMQRVRDAIANGVGWAFDRIRHPRAPALIDDDMLDDRERALIEALRLHLPQDPHRTIETVAMCAGAGPIRRGRGRPVLLLPRRNPTVAACAVAVASDPSWAYPAYLALLDRFGHPPEALRRAFLQDARSDTRRAGPRNQATLPWPGPPTNRGS
jgi:hypothetical protein